MVLKICTLGGVRSYCCGRRCNVVMLALVISIITNLLFVASYWLRKKAELDNDAEVAGILLSFRRVHVIIDPFSFLTTQKESILNHT